MQAPEVTAAVLTIGETTTERAIEQRLSGLHASPASTMLRHVVRGSR
jgi:hypothetical protein